MFADCRRSFFMMKMQLLNYLLGIDFVFSSKALKWAIIRRINDEDNMVVE